MRERKPTRADASSATVALACTAGSPRGSTGQSIVGRARADAPNDAVFGVVIPSVRGVPRCARAATARAAKSESTRTMAVARATATRRRVSAGAAAPGVERRGVGTTLTVDASRSAAISGRPRHSRRPAPRHTCPIALRHPQRRPIHRAFPRSAAVGCTSPRGRFGLGRRS